MLWLRSEYVKAWSCWTFCRSGEEISRGIILPCNPQKSTQTSFSHGFSILFTKFRWGLNFREGVRGVMSSAEVEGSPQAMPYRLFLTLSLIVHSKVNDQLRHEVWIEGSQHGYVRIGYLFKKTLYERLAVHYISKDNFCKNQMIRCFFFITRVKDNNIIKRVDYIIHCVRIRQNKTDYFIHTILCVFSLIIL